MPNVRENAERISGLLFMSLGIVDSPTDLRIQYWSHAYIWHMPNACQQLWCCDHQRIQDCAG